MNPPTSIPSAAAGDEISMLIETLVAAEQRLEELTAGEVDTVAGRDGRTFLLRRAQEHLRHSEAAKQAAILGELRVLVDLVPAMIWFKDTNNVFLRVNKRVAATTGMSVAEIEGKSAYDIFPHEAAGYYADDLDVIRSAQPKLGIIEKLRSPQGQEIWVQTDKVPVCDQNGTVTGLIAMVHDITDRERSAALLAESGRRLALAKESARIGTWEWEVESGKLVWDTQMYAIYGIREEDFSGAYEVWKNGVHPEDRTRGEAELFAAVAGTEGFHTEFRIVRPDGEVRHVEAHATIYRAADGNSTRLLGVNWDITDRKRTDENVKRLAAIVESSADAIISKNLKGIVTSWNPAAEKMFGYPAAEIIGQPLLMLLPPDRAHEQAEILAEFAKGAQVRHFETVRVRKGGKHFEVSATISPILDAGGNIIGVSKIVRDITELKKLEQQFRQAQKMESFGQLAGGVAHDFNNILAVINIQATLLKEGGRLVPEHFKYACEIISSVDRAAALTRQLLLFSRKETLQLRDLDLNQSVNGMTIMLRRILGEHIQIQFKFAMETLGIHADPGMMDQVLMNLAVNSRDAMPGGGQLVIQTSVVKFDQTAVAEPGPARPGTFVCLGVSDTGSGIAPEDLPRIFEPFFTTKEVGKGTGLGLATIFGIVQQHKGWVTVESEVGIGTTFRIYLPRLAKICQVSQLPVQPKLGMLPRGTETVLYVEDDDFLRPYISDTLARLGYHVLTASNGVKALEIWSQQRDEIHLLLTDLVMPGGITGKQLGERLLNENPKLKVIYVSGYSAEAAGTDLSLQEGVNFLAKPFQAQKLAEIMRKHLEPV